MVDIAARRLLVHHLRGREGVCYLGHHGADASCSFHLRARSGPLPNRFVVCGKLPLPSPNPRFFALHNSPIRHLDDPVPSRNLPPPMSPPDFLVPRCHFKPLGQCLHLCMSAQRLCLDCAPSTPLRSISPGTPPGSLVPLNQPQSVVALSPNAHRPSTTFSSTGFLLPSGFPVILAHSIVALVC